MKMGLFLRINYKRIVYPSIERANDECCTGVIAVVDEQEASVAAFFVWLSQELLHR
jgi:hypothetical protein